MYARRLLVYVHAGLEVVREESDKQQRREDLKVPLRQRALESRDACRNSRWMSYVRASARALLSAPSTDPAWFGVCSARFHVALRPLVTPQKYRKARIPIAFHVARRLLKLGIISYANRHSTVNFFFLNDSRYCGQGRHLNKVSEPCRSAMGNKPSQSRKATSPRRANPIVPKQDHKYAY